MADLLSPETVAQIRGAMRDVTDTFHKYPVVLRQGSGETNLSAGRKTITGELQAREGGDEIDEAYRLTFNRECLAEKGFVDDDGLLLIGYDDTFMMDEKRFHIAKITESTAFRNEPLLVLVEVVR